MLLSPLDFFCSGYRAIAGLINTLISSCSFLLLFWGEINALGFFINLVNSLSIKSNTMPLQFFSLLGKYLPIPMNFKLGIYCIAREKWWLCEMVPGIWAWCNRAGAGLSRAVKSSCSTLPEIKKGKTHSPGDLFQLCVIFVLFFAGFRGWPQRMTSKTQLRRFQNIPHPVCQPLCQSLSHKFSLLIVSNSVTAGFGSSFTSNLKWRRKTTEWSTTAVKHQQRASCILIPAGGQQRTRSWS